MSHILSLVVLSSLALLCAECLGSQNAFFSIYGLQNCSQVGFNATVTSPLVSGGAVFFNGNFSDVSVKVFGLWKLQPQRKGCEYNDVFVNGLDESCVQLNLTPPCNDSNVGILFDRIGSADLRKKELFLYDNENFTGSVFKIRNDSFALKSSIFVRSYHMKGVFEWTTYEQTNFTGAQLRLLGTRSVAKQGYGVSFKTSVHFKVGSVRLRSQEPIST